MDKNDELFKGTSFADLMSDVYHNSKKKDRQINQLIAQLQPLIKNASDATIIVPLIKEYLDVAVKNDDHLVKLTGIVQRYISTKQTISGADSLLSDEEKEQLLKIAEKTLWGRKRPSWKQSGQTIFTVSTEKRLQNQKL